MKKTVEYISAQKAAKKWRTSERLAQKYCQDGRVEGAKKFGNSWAIPADARKPIDPRKARKQAKKRKLSKEKSPARPAMPCTTPMPLMNAPFTPGKCLEYVMGIENGEVRDIAMAEYYYFCGRPEDCLKMAERYLSHPDPALRLSACLLYGYANLSEGKPQRVGVVLKKVKTILARTDEKASPQLYAGARFVVTTASVLLHLPLPEGMERSQDYVRFLPAGLKMFALYVQAHQAYLQGEYGESLGIVEAALMIYGKAFPIPAIYMHLVAVMAHISLKCPEKAQEHLLAAWGLAKADDLIQAFGEHHGLLGGMLEVVIKKDWPEDFKRIIAITYRFSDGWRKAHRLATGEDVAGNLTTTEFAAAMLAARGWTNREIAQHMGISMNTVKRYMSTILEKLGIKQRKDLKKYMLR